MSQIWTCLLLSNCRKTLLPISRSDNFAKNMCFSFAWKWQNHQLQGAKNCVPIVVLGVIGETSLRAMQMQWRETECPQPRETEGMIFKTGLNQPFTERLVEGESGSSDSARESILHKHFLHIFWRDPRTRLEGNTFYSLIFRRTPLVIYRKRTQITRDSCRRHPEGPRRQDTTSNQQLEIQRITKLSTKRTDRGCIIDMLKWYRLRLTNEYRVIRAENKTAQNSRVI